MSIASRSDAKTGSRSLDLPFSEYKDVSVPTDIDTNSCSCCSSSCCEFTDGIPCQIISGCIGHFADKYQVEGRVGGTIVKNMGTTTAFLVPVISAISNPYLTGVIVTVAGVTNVARAVRKYYQVTAEINTDKETIENTQLIAELKDRSNALKAENTREKANTITLLSTLIDRHGQRHTIIKKDIEIRKADAELKAKNAELAMLEESIFGRLKIAMEKVTLVLGDVVAAHNPVEQAAAKGGAQRAMGDLKSFMNREEAHREEMRRTDKGKRRKKTPVDAEIENVFPEDEKVLEQKDQPVFIGGLSQGSDSKTQLPERKDQPPGDNVPTEEEKEMVVLQDEIQFFSDLIATIEGGAVLDEKQRLKLESKNKLAVPTIQANPANVSAVAPSSEVKQGESVVVAASPSRESKGELAITINASPATPPAVAVGTSTVGKTVSILIAGAEYLFDGASAAYFVANWAGAIFKVLVGVPSAIAAVGFYMGCSSESTQQEKFARGRKNRLKQKRTIQALIVDFKKEQKKSEDLSTVTAKIMTFAGISPTILKPEDDESEQENSPEVSSKGYFDKIKKFSRKAVSTLSSFNPFGRKTTPSRSKSDETTPPSAGTHKSAVVKADLSSVAAVITALSVPAAVADIQPPKGKVTPESMGHLTLPGAVPPTELDAATSPLATSLQPLLASDAVVPFSPPALPASQPVSPVTPAPSKKPHRRKPEEADAPTVTGRHHPQRNPGQPPRHGRRTPTVVSVSPNPHSVRNGGSRAARHSPRTPSLFPAAVGGSSSDDSLRGSLPVARASSSSIASKRSIV